MHILPNKEFMLTAITDFLFVNFVIKSNYADIGYHSTTHKDIKQQLKTFELKLLQYLVIHAKITLRSKA